MGMGILSRCTIQFNCDLSYDVSFQGKTAKLYDNPTRVLEYAGVAAQSNGRYADEDVSFEVDDFDFIAEDDDFDSLEHLIVDLDDKHGRPIRFREGTGRGAFSRRSAN